MTTSETTMVPQEAKQEPVHCFTRNQLVDAFKRWHEDAQRGLCLTNEQALALAPEEHAAECTRTLLAYLDPSL